MDRPDVALLILSGLPLRLRRRLLRVTWALSVFFRRTEGRFGIDEVIARTLKVSRREARRIDRELHFHDRLHDLEWLAASRASTARMERDAATAEVDDAALFDRLAATSDPIVLAPIHMGNFAIGLAYVLHRFFRGRPLLVLRARDDLPVWDIAVARLAEVAGDLKVVNIADKAGFVDAMRFARRPGAVTICFFDLPASYGTPADVRLFAEPARIALGLDALARMVKGVVVPLAVESGMDGDRIVIGRPFEVAGSSAEERASVARRMATQLERFVYAAPAQWHMWTRIHEFHLPDESEGLIHGVA